MSTATIELPVIAEPATEATAVQGAMRVWTITEHTANGSVVRRNVPQRDIAQELHALIHGS